MKKNKNVKWILTITFLAFFITVIFSLLSSKILEDVGILVGVIVIFLFIVIGVVFDIVGVAVQSSDTVPFHAMASKKIKGATVAKKMLKNSAKVSSFCNDVIGDICNIISGSAGLVVSTSMAEKLSINHTLSALLVTSITAALTIGAKAMGKGIAVSKSEYIVTKVTKVINKFSKK